MISILDRIRNIEKDKLKGITVDFGDGYTVTKIWHTSGAPYTERHKLNGKDHGPTFSWNKNADLMAINNYMLGVITSTEKYERKKIKERREYDENGKLSQVEIWNSKGQLTKKDLYKDGKRVESLLSR